MTIAFYQVVGVGDPLTDSIFFLALSPSPNGKKKKESQCSIDLQSVTIIFNIVTKLHLTSCFINKNQININKCNHFSTHSLYLQTSWLDTINSKVLLTLVLIRKSSRDEMRGFFYYLIFYIWQKFGKISQVQRAIKLAASEELDVFEVERREYTHLNMLHTEGTT